MIAEMTRLRTEMFAKMFAEMFTLSTEIFAKLETFTFC